MRRDWYAATPPKPTDGLQLSLLAQETRAAGGLLRVNFDPALLAFSEEVCPYLDPCMRPDSDTLVQARVHTRSPSKRSGYPT